MNERIKLNCERSDASLSFARVLLLLWCWLIGIGSVIGGIVLMSEGDEGLGALLFIIGPLIAFITYFAVMTLIWALYDLKLIRTACTQFEVSDELLHFAKGAEQYDEIADEEDSSTEGDENESEKTEEESEEETEDKE